MHITPKFLTGLTAALCTAFAVLPAAAQNPTTDPFQIHVGGFLLTDVSSQVQFDTPNRPGTPIDFVDVLGGESSLNVFRADASWRFADRHRVDASWFDINQTAQHTLTADITFGGEDYTINTVVESHFRTSIYQLSYGYLLKRSGRHEFFGLLGMHITRFDTGISLAGGGRLQRFAATAPLPVLGLAWNAQWNDRLSSHVALQYFGLSLDDGKASGHFVDTLAVVEYKFNRHFGIGGGYNRFDLEADLYKGQAHLALNNAYNGFLVYLFTQF